MKSQKTLLSKMEIGSKNEMVPWFVPKAASHETKKMPADKVEVEFKLFVCGSLSTANNSLLVRRNYLVFNALPEPGLSAVQIFHVLSAVNFDNLNCLYDKLRYKD